jgi:hypothetical protein
LVCYRLIRQVQAQDISLSALRDALAGLPKVASRIQMKTILEAVAYLDKLRKYYANQSQLYKAKGLMAAHVENTIKRDTCSKILGFINAEEIEKAKLWQRENLNRIKGSKNDRRK